MGYMRHNAIIVTSNDRDLIRQARSEAMLRFAGLAQVSELLASSMNKYLTFVVAPDGSKEGWTESNYGDTARRMLIEWLDNQRYEDGSTSLKWAEIQYGDDEGETKIVRDSDERERAVQNEKGPNQ